MPIKKTTSKSLNDCIGLISIPRFNIEFDLSYFLTMNEYFTKYIIGQFDNSDESKIVSDSITENYHKKLCQ